MNSNPYRVERLPGFDLHELGRALLMAALIATVITGLSIETERLDELSARAQAIATQTSTTQAAPTPTPDAERAVVPTDAPLRGLSQSEIWAADESAHGLRPEAAH